jgi:hypothetical protein
MDALEIDAMALVVFGVFVDMMSNVGDIGTGVAFSRQPQSLALEVLELLEEVDQEASEVFGDSTEALDVKASLGEAGIARLIDPDGVRYLVSGVRVQIGLHGGVDGVVGEDHRAILLPKAFHAAWKMARPKSNGQETDVSTRSSNKRI